MIIAKVIDRVVSTRKSEALVGSKFLIVEPVQSKQGTLVAVDTIGAGVGDFVLVTLGSSARMASTNEKAPIDAAVVGIIDE